MGRLWRDSGGSSEPLTRHTARSKLGAARSERTQGQSVGLLVRLVLASLVSVASLSPTAAAIIKHTATRPSQGGTGCGRMTGHCLSPSLVSPLRCLSAEQTDLFTARERASAVRAALKEWLGWWAGLLLAADGSPNRGSAAARKSLCLFLSLWADLHRDFARETAGK